MDMRLVLGRRHLAIREVRTRNLIHKPILIPRGTYTRAHPLSYSAARTRLRNECQLEARHGTRFLEFDVTKDKVLP